MHRASARNSLLDSQAHALGKMFFSTCGLYFSRRKLRSRWPARIVKGGAKPERDRARRAGADLLPSMATTGMTSVVAPVMKASCAA